MHDALPHTHDISVSTVATWEKKPRHHAAGLFVSLFKICWPTRCVWSSFIGLDCFSKGFFVCWL
jgi:hypothetical protein